MRNEIFKKISQNRKRYLAENSLIEISNDKPKDKPGSANDRPGTTSPSTSAKTSLTLGSGLTNSVTRFVIKKFEDARSNFPFDNIRDKMEKIGAVRRQKLQSANRKLTKGSEKIFENFVNYSDRFFEDRFVNVNETDPDLKSFALQTVGSPQLVWEFSDSKMQEGFFPPFHKSHLGYMIKKIENSFVRNWKKIIFSLELDGLLLEVGRAKLSSIKTSGKHIKIAVNKSNSSFNEKAFAKYDSIENRRSIPKKKRVDRIINRLEKAMNQVSVHFPVKIDSNISVKPRNQSAGLLSNKSVSLHRKIFTDINRFIVG